MRTLGKLVTLVIVLAVWVSFSIAQEWDEPTEETQELTASDPMGKH